MTRSRCATTGSGFQPVRPSRLRLRSRSWRPIIESQSAFRRRLSVSETTGAEVAIITRRGIGNRYEILGRGELTTVRPRGAFGQRFEINSPAGQLEARGNFSGRQYVVTRGGSQAAAVKQLRTLREKFAVEVTENEDPVLMLAVGACT